MGLDIFKSTEKVVIRDQDSTEKMMIYQLLMMAAICVAAFSLSTNDKKVIMEKWKKSDANCSMKVGSCGGKCLPKIQTMIDCKKECKEPLFKKDGSSYLSEPDSPCVCKCWVEGMNKCRKECMGDC